MLAARSLRLASAARVHHSFCASPSRIRTLAGQPMVMGWVSRPLAASYCKDVKPSADECNLSETSLTSNIPKITPDPSDKTSFTKTDKDPKTKTAECSTGGIADVGVKLPSKDQVESFLFKSLVYFWDFAYYVFCLCRKLIETYVFQNSTVQSNWKQLLKRMEDARKDIKSK